MQDSNRALASQDFQFEKVVINYGKHSIPIEVVCEERNQLALTVRPDMTVEARAPLGSD